VQGHELIETAAAVVLVAAGLFVVPASAWALANSRHRSPPVNVSPARDLTGMSLGSTTLLIAAALSLAAAVIHFAAVPPHLDEFPPYAYAFALLGIAQVVLAVGLVRRWEHVRTLSIVLSVGVVAVWVMSRTVGLPIGAEPWEAEPIAFADVVATAFEIALIALLLVRPQATAIVRSAYVAIVPIVGVIGVVTLIAIAALGGDGGHVHG